MTNRGASLPNYVPYSISIYRTPNNTSIYWVSGIKFLRWADDYAIMEAAGCGENETIGIKLPKNLYSEKKGGILTSVIELVRRGIKSLFFLTQKYIIYTNL